MTLDKDALFAEILKYLSPKVAKQLKFHAIEDFLAFTLQT